MKTKDSTKTDVPQSRSTAGLDTALQITFVQGTAWWEERSTGGTMWASDRDDAEAEAFAKMCNGTLGKVYNVKLTGSALLRSPG